ncbi:hypothetical protein Rhe02_55300 [Rhizocola hellebori]|uniref:Helix-turn-helix domain-containing protein n=1 Tax=Rhizocola hellebori TaxID=1392758 RepID=A0A8J3QD19_9ACTN|nr:hypothetical protein Rhe02_55300 [Rhizocola hellebori]
MFRQPRSTTHPVKEKASDRNSITTPHQRPCGAIAIPAQTTREIYTVAEVAVMLGLTLGGAYELVRDGTIPALKLGGRWVIPKKRFHAWLVGFQEEASS